MPKNNEIKLKHHEPFILSCLKKGPLTKERLLQEYERFVQFMGFPVTFSNRKRGWAFHRQLDDYLNHLQSLALVVSENGAYRLTESGAEEAQRRYERVRTAHNKLRASVLSPETASKLSVSVNAAVASLKLTVGFAFNSVALVADGFDSLVDVSSAIAVFLGIKHKRELVSTSFIILMMFGTAGYIGYESVSRLISPESVETTALTVLAAIISGGVCYLMSIYQHYIGKRSGSISLLSQSIDSRNHGFQAAAVLIGLIFAAFGIFLVDSIVALLVAGLILKSAIELTMETIRMARGEELDTTRFGREYEQAVRGQRRRFFKTWLLLNLKEMNNRDDILARYHYVFAPDDLPIVTVVNPVAGFDFLNQLDVIMQELADDGLVIIQGDRFYLTDKGRRMSNRRLARARFGIPF